MSVKRLTTWIEWYRFARRVLGLGHEEAAQYATARYLEELNRERGRARTAA